MLEGHEPSSFTCLFPDWSVLVSERGSSAGSPEPAGADGGAGPEEAGKVQWAVDVEALHRPVPRFTGLLLTEDAAATGELDVYRVDGTNIVLVRDGDHGLFSSCFSYLIMYTYVQSKIERTVVYFWQGKHTPHFSALRWKYDLAPELMKGLRDERGIAPDCVRVMQGQEPDHFLTLFSGNRRMVVFDDAQRLKKALGNAAENEESAHDQLMRAHAKVGRLTLLGSLVKHWRRHTFALDVKSRVLHCARSAVDLVKNNVVVSFNLFQAHVYVADYIKDACMKDVVGPSSFCFELTVLLPQPRQYYLAADSQRELFDWISSLSLCALVFHSPVADASWLKYVVQTARSDAKEKDKHADKCGADGFNDAASIAAGSEVSFASNYSFGSRLCVRSRSSSSLASAARRASTSNSLSEQALNHGQLLVLDGEAPPCSSLQLGLQGFLLKKSALCQMCPSRARSDRDFVMCAACHSTEHVCG